MSQSDFHKNLVVKVSKRLRACDPTLMVTADIPQMYGDDVPPLIGAFRPDVYATSLIIKGPIIAEAKTDKDIDNEHTRQQVAAFLSYLEDKGNGIFVLAVSGSGADRAKTVLRFICHADTIKHTIVKVFDSYDFWTLDVKNKKIWHLD